ncbi:hypothetical protein Ddc_21128 [Ditylenchus destructor]|nr:hypothetical protein Ddc_21128 [Ditylenchus destructor]
MHRSRLAEKQAKLTNEAQDEPKAKKNRSADETTTIVIVDNDAMVETFKFLDYCQLAKNSLVSKRFRDLICDHRHKLPLLYVDGIYMNEVTRSYNLEPAVIIMFHKELSPEEYNEWVICNNYSMQIPPEYQFYEYESGQYDEKAYQLRVNLGYKDSHYFESEVDACADCHVFFACAIVNHKNWPLFQHFIRLLTDPFIYIRYLTLKPLKVFLNLLTGAINSGSGRLKCDTLAITLQRRTLIEPIRINSRKFLSWIKEHVLCDEFCVFGNNYYDTSNHDEGLLDFFMTGANCASEICVGYYDISEVIFDYVERFVNLKASDEYQMVESIQCYGGCGAIEVLKRYYDKFVTKEEKDHGYNVLLFELTNNSVEKKLQITTRFDEDKELDDIMKQYESDPVFPPENFPDDDGDPEEPLLSLKITNLY